MKDDSFQCDPTVRLSSAEAGGDETDDDPRLVGAVREYMAAAESGRRPERAEFLARHVDIAAELAACIDGLAFVQSAARQMGRSADETGNESPHDFAQPLGDFKLVRELGRGGAGVVYEAYQLSLGRRVAVKVLSMAAALDERQLRRFHNEAQAAAQLHHSNIVPVYAVGCERSVHYYAMQLIDGQSMAEVITAVRRGSDESDGSSAAGLSSLHSTRRGDYFRAIARLGAQAADALHYAHQLGVVHRDIKPANLLLDARGNPWITDFGLAQCYADHGLTQTGDLVGTLRYMSPEQAGGRAVVLDQRTDIYSLGVTLFEMLTLERAVAVDRRELLLRRIAHDPLPSLRSIDPAIPAELDTIILKAAAKDASERYATAADLAEDLRRFLADEPILARPPSTWDKAVKWTRRHRSVAVSALAVLLIALAGSLISTMMIARAQARTKAAYESEQRKSAEAQRSFRQAREAVDFFSRVAAERMDEPPFLDVRKQLLEAALDYYQRFLREAATPAAAAAELTAARAQVAAILTELAAFDELGRLQARARLLAEAGVQQALGVSESQAQAVRQAAFSAQDRPFDPNEMRQLSSEQKRQRFSALADRIEEAIGRNLSPAQAKRLEEISRRLRGPATFSDGDVVEALQLTREQREIIRHLQSQYRDAIRESFRRGGPDEAGHGGPVGPFRGGLINFGRPGGDFVIDRQKSDQTVARILEILNEQQQSIWATLIGEPFTGPWPQVGHPPGKPGFDFQ